MTTTLYLFKETLFSKPVKFPDTDDQAYIADYKYSATRMSSAPNITATLKWPSCLDDKWSTRVFVEYNGEKFFVKNTPSSSYDNTSCLYSHSLELVSERAILDSVYFLNVPTATSGEGDNSQGDSLSDSTEFAFSGDIYEFVDRLNKSLEKSGISYSAEVDKGVTSDTKLFSISNQYVTDVLKSAYELYEVPYYFVGKKIHFGNQQTIINSPPLKYGANSSLLSISKSNSNKQVVTRITGSGSDRNIPYYYPNQTPKGVLKLTGKSSDKYIIVDQKKFASYIDLDKPIIYRNVRSTSSSIDLDEESLYKKVTLSNVTSGIIYQASLDNGFYKIEFDGWTSGTSYVHPFVPLEICRGYLNVLSWDGIFLDGYAEHNGKRVKIVNRNDSQYPYYVLKYETSFPQSKYAKHVIYFRWTDGPKDIMFSGFRSSLAEETASLSNLILKRADIDTFTTTLEVKSQYSGAGYVYCKPIMEVNGVEVIDTISCFKEGEVLSGKTGEKKSTIWVSNGTLRFGKLEAGTYIVKNSFSVYSDSPLLSVSLRYEEVPYNFWEYSGSRKEIDFSQTGLALSKGAEMELGDSITQAIEYRIDVKTSLMPSVYRRTKGKDMWYNATNATNRGKWYGDVVFDNEYDNRHPVEYIHTDDSIYPTIKGMTNDAGKCIDTFLDIAFDQFDNNEIYPEDYEDEKLAGKYKHPYFFVKLKKTDGPNGFNLFDHAIENEPMKISFTTGHVAGCEFEIGVDEDSQKNLVQVYTEDTVVDGFLYKKGTLKIDSSGDILCGRLGQEKQSPQDDQQDTLNNEVWIALKKEDSTMGVMMPDSASQLVPLGDLLITGEERDGGGDKFVILGIQLPDTYITAAEDRLEQELIKQLKENNRERFSFSLKLSSIYLAENEAFAKTLNENSRVTLLYNDTSYTMYVTSYSLTVKESSALPEVTISINDELKVVKPKMKDVSSFIDSTDTKIKDVKRESTTIKAQALSATVASRENAEDIRILQEMLANVDLSSLASQVLENTANINILGRRVTVAILDEDYSQPEQASFMYGLRPEAELDQGENNDTTIALAEDNNDATTYVINKDLGDIIYEDTEDTEFMIEDAIIVEEIIEGEIICSIEDDVQSVISVDGEDDTTLVEETDDYQDYIIVNEDDEQTIITNC